MSASAFFLSALALCTAPQSAAPLDGPASRARALAIELHVREAAADPIASAAWLDAALSKTAGNVAWTEIADALDALARALEARPEIDIDRWRPWLLELTADPHPNVRAGAWRVLAHSPKDSDRAREFSGSVRTWEERLEEARAIARGAADASKLESLCHDSDRRVGEIALAEWMQSPARDDERAALSWIEAFEEARASGDERKMRLLELLERAPRGKSIAVRVAGLEKLRGDGGGSEAGALHALCLAALARQAASLSDDDLDRLAADWNSAWRGSPGARAMLARAARALGPPLGERLLAQSLAHADDFELASNCLAGAVEALDSARLLRSVAPQSGRHPALAEALLDCLRGLVDTWNPPELAAWLARDVAPSQRAHTVLVVAETFRQNRDPGSAMILVQALADPSAPIAAEAFQGLAGAQDPTPWMESLHTAWSARPIDWQEARLADLSREISWTPFRADLLELASRSRTASARVAELLAPFRGDREVADALREWLEQDLARLRQSARGGPDSELGSNVVSSALALVKALAQVDGDRANSTLVEALDSSRGRSVELGKATIFQLGRSEDGRKRIGECLSAGTPARLRAEAALALATYPPREAAIQILLQDYERYDEELRTRALRAFAQADDPQSAARLRSVARSTHSGAGEMIAAVECLGARARREQSLADELPNWLDDERLDSELRMLLIAELGKLGRESVFARLSARLALIESGRESGQAALRAAEDQAQEREALISALSNGDAVGALADKTAFDLPLQRAGADFAARASGQHRAEVEFTARAELSLIAAFARAGRLEHALDDVPGWRALDARFLLESAARAGSVAEEGATDGPRARERLALAASIALGGEAEVDDTQRARFEARRQALEGARERKDDAAFAARAAQLERDVRSGAVSAWLFARAYGDFDPRQGTDGLARLACDVHLARTRLALGKSDRELARRELRAARESCGASQAALAAVELAEKELESKGR